MIETEELRSCGERVLESVLRMTLVVAFGSAGGSEAFLWTDDDYSSSSMMITAISCGRISIYIMWMYLKNLRCCEIWGFEAVSGVLYEYSDCRSCFMKIPTAGVEATKTKATAASRYDKSWVLEAIHKICKSLLSPPKVVHLYERKWVEESTYPRFTMIGQSLGSVYLSWEALSKFTPLYYFDTSGYAFTYSVARLFGCKVVCYTHYPTISLDMLSRVQTRSSIYSNDCNCKERFIIPIQSHILHNF